MNAQATLTRNGKTRKIRNLGWLLKNWKEIEKFEINYPLRETDGAAILRAHLKCGGQYQITFASAQVCWNFLHRPVFFGLTMQWGAGAYFEIIKGDAYRPLGLAVKSGDAGNESHPLVWNVTGLAYRRDGVWRTRMPDSGWRAARFWMRVTDPRTIGRMNAAYNAGAMPVAKTFANPVLIRDTGDEYVVENESGETLYTADNRADAEVWVFENGCVAIPGTWADYHR